MSCSIAFTIPVPIRLSSNFVSLECEILTLFKSAETLTLLPPESMGEIFVYVSQNSKNVGETFSDACDIELLSGKERK